MASRTHAFLRDGHKPALGYLQLVPRLVHWLHSLLKLGECCFPSVGRKYGDGWRWCTFGVARKTEPSATVLFLLGNDVLGYGRE